MAANTKPILALDTGLPLGVYRAVEEEVEVHTPNSKVRRTYTEAGRGVEPDPDYDPARPECPRLPCFGREDDCPNVAWVPAYRLVSA